MPVIENVSSPVRPSDSAVSPCGELQREDAHADQVGAVDALVGLGDDGLHAQQRGALGGPVARRAGAVLLAGRGRRAGCPRRCSSRDASKTLVTSPSGGEVARDAALGAGRELVAQADVGEGAADHDLVVAAARAVGVEVALLDAVLGEVAARRAVLLDRAGRADVVGGDRVAQLEQHAGAVDVGRPAPARRACRRSTGACGRRSSSASHSKVLPSGVGSDCQRSSPAKTSW